MSFVNNPDRLDDDVGTFVTTPLSGVQTLDLNSDRSFTLAHNAKDEAGNADTNDIIVYTSGGGAMNFDRTAGKGKVILLSTRAIAIVPGTPRLWFKAVNGQPTFTVAPSERFYGRV